MITLIRKNYRVIGIHLLFWLAFILYNIIDAGWTGKDSWIFSIRPSLATDLVVIVPIVYINYYLLMPVFYSKGKYIQYICCFILLLFMGGLGTRFFAFSIWLPLEHLGNPSEWEPGNFWIPARIIKNIAKIFPVIAATMIIRLVGNAYRQEKRIREIERESYDAEIGLLKAQINPHFFFNTLNSLYSLSMEASPKSPKMIMHLADLMRYMLYDTSASKVLLTDELAHLENYIGIERMRFADHLDLSFQYSGEIEGQWITPLLLLPFVENAFKHGVEKDGGWVTIDLKVSEKRLYMKVENSFTEIPGQTHRGGMGLKNVKRRLALIYPSHHQLNVEHDNDVFKVDLKIDL